VVWYAPCKGDSIGFPVPQFTYAVSKCGPVVSGAKSRLRGLVGGFRGHIVSSGLGLELVYSVQVVGSLHCVALVVLLGMGGFTLRVLEEWGDAYFIRVPY